jgi:uncharacterized membrane protein HdeD (DUF308 family)
MILLGAVALFLPFATGIAVSILLSWIIILAGCAFVASAFAGRDDGAFIWRMLIGVVYIAGGGYLAFHSTIALESFTMVLGLIFVLEGILDLVVFFQFHDYPRSGWILFDAIISLVLAYLIMRPWPTSSMWAIGIILGIDLIVSGVTRVIYGSSARRAMKELSI